MCAIGSDKASSIGTPTGVGPGAGALQNASPGTRAVVGGAGKTPIKSGIPNIKIPSIIYP